jgi:DNA topoisomerase IA
MTELLKKAVKRVSDELSDSEQDRVAEYLLRLIDEDDARWDEVLAKSPEKLRKMADRALKQHRAGKTTILDVNKL